MLPDLRNPLQTVICPYCFEKFNAADIWFRCNETDPQRCAHEPDEIVQRYQRLPQAPQLSKPFPPPQLGQGYRALLQKILPDRIAPCPECGHNTPERICPACHAPLSHTIIDLAQPIIAVVGGRNAGKSHYLAVTISHLQRRIAERVGLSIRPLDDQVLDIYRRCYYAPLYEGHQTLPQTRPAAQNQDVRQPLIFNCSFGPTGRSVNLIFFDAAAEDLMNLESLERFNRYILHASGILLLIDAATMVDSDAGGRDAGYSPAPTHLVIVDQLLKIHERWGNLHAGRGLKIPLAVALTKIDAIRHRLVGNDFLFRPADHTSIVDIKELRRVSDAVRAQIGHHAGANFLNLIDARFPTSSFFAISSLGSPPDHEHVAEISPLRVEDPLLWMLWKFGFLVSNEDRIRFNLPRW